MPSVLRTAPDLGLQTTFDVRNLDYLIADKLADATREAERAAMSVTRGAFARVNETAFERALQALTWKRHWRHPWDGNQGQTPRCTGFSGIKAWLAGPVTHTEEDIRARALSWGIAGAKTLPLGTVLDAMADVLYRRAQSIDRREGRYYSEGATMLAEAKAMQELGLIEAYWWGYTIAEYVAAMREGPVLLGIDWYEGMDNPDRKHGVIRRVGAIRGGHAIVSPYVDFDDGFGGVDQTWGRGSWGVNGQAKMPLEDLEQLIAAGGELLFIREKAIETTAKAA